MQQATQLAKTFDGLQDYVQNLLSVLDKISKTVDGEKDTTFWKSIYKFENGSAGPSVTGWITALFAYVSTRNGPVLKQGFDWEIYPYTTDQFPIHVSKVDFNWNYLDKNIPMCFISGVIGTEFRTQSLSPKLGYAVVEYAK